MEQRIQYAVTSDGLNIALATSGEGPPLVSIPGPPDNHLQLEWEQPSMRENVERMSRHRTVVRFDGRGTGLSDRDTRDYSLDARMRDMEAAVERLGIERFPVVAGGHGVQLAVAFATRYPDRVTHMVAVDPFVRGDEWMDSETIELMQQILLRDFDMFTQAVGARIFGWGNEQGPRYSSFFRAAVNQRDASRIYNSMFEEDLEPLLGQVRCPVLVIRHVKNESVSLEATRRFTSLVPNASLVVLEGGAREGGSEAMRREIASFLGDPMDEYEQAQSPPLPAGTLRVLLFTDVEQHTRLMAELGDARGREVLREHERITRAELSRHGGDEIKAMGDGFLVSFVSAQRALECAVELQRALAGNPATLGLRIRIGINAGEPIQDDGDLFGQSVIAAARLCQAAGGGEILVADVVRLLVAGKGFLFTDRGEMQLRGFEEPARAYALLWEH
jgi:class 3 adenylate cyclase/pimeloyl-ACP methyl ester carboxylesterase